ncbi:uncharacterized protein LOC125649013 [Ostrea edulis]|uniref:uncharacterized protein LOC125649013 n=1 Tax=Ostrea edulis TaxID=37623 RepID=UPI0024AF5D1B|nr:uncharacterized protein LOC125649013 [Ostrea edulis]
MLYSVLESKDGGDQAEEKDKTPAKDDEKDGTDKNEEETTSVKLCPSLCLAFIFIFVSISSEHCQCLLSLLTQNVCFSRFTANKDKGDVEEGGDITPANEGRGDKKEEAAAVAGEEEGNKATSANKDKGDVEEGGDITPTNKDKGDEKEKEAAAANKDEADDGKMTSANKEKGDKSEEEEATSANENKGTKEDGETASANEDKESEGEKGETTSVNEDKGNEGEVNKNGENVGEDKGVTAVVEEKFTDIVSKWYEFVTDKPYTEEVTETYTEKGKPEVDYVTQVYEYITGSPYTETFTEVYTEPYTEIVYEYGTKAPEAPVKCGGRISGISKGEVTSPKFPKKYPLNVVCIWNITVSKRHLIKMQFPVLRLGKGDRIDLYDTKTGEHIGRAQGHEDGFEEISQRNEVTMSFSSDGEFQDEGFKMTFRAIKDPSKSTASDRTKIQKIKHGYKTVYAMKHHLKYKTGKKVKAEETQNPTEATVKEIKAPTEVPVEETKPPTESPVEEAKPPTESPVQKPKAPTESPIEETKPPTEAPVEETKPPTESPVEEAKPPTESPVEEAKPPTESPVEETKPPTESPVEETKPPTESPVQKPKAPTESPIEETKPPTESPVIPTKPDTKTPNEEKPMGNKTPTLPWKCNCGENISGKSHGVITSPNFPRNYPVERLCSWNISVPEEHVILLNFPVLRVEKDYDMVFIYDTITGDHIGRLTGNKDDFQTLSPSNEVTIFFSSDDYRGDMGFNMTFEAISLHPATEAPTTKSSTSTVAPTTPAPIKCGGDITGESSGEIESPKFPSNYPPGITCRWNITVAEREIIKLFFPVLWTEADFDKIVIYDTSTGEYIENLSGHRDGFETLSISNRVTIFFSADDKNSEMGFNMTFEAITPTPAEVKSTVPPFQCGGDISGKSEGEIDSPGFGVENYPKDITCTWKITVEEGKLIKIFSTYVNTESDADIIYFYDTTTGKLLDSVSGYSKSFETFSLNNTITVFFSSDENTTATGFQLEFKAFSPATEAPFTAASVCGGEISGKSEGEIASPNFPSEYPLDINCTWIITVAEGKFIRLLFPIVQTEKNHDLIVVKTGNYYDELSGRENDFEVFSESNKATIFFSSDSNVPDMGFNMTFQALNPKTVKQKLADKEKERTESNSDQETQQGDETEKDSTKSDKNLPNGKKTEEKISKSDQETQQGDETEKDNTKSDKEVPNSKKTEEKISKSDQETQQGDETEKDNTKSDKEVPNSKETEEKISKSDQETQQGDEAEKDNTKSDKEVPNSKETEEKISKSDQETQQGDETEKDNTKSDKEVPNSKKTEEKISKSDKETQQGDETEKDNTKSDKEIPNGKETEEKISKSDKETQQGDETEKDNTKSDKESQQGDETEKDSTKSEKETQEGDETEKDNTKSDKEVPNGKDSEEKISKSDKENQQGDDSEKDTTKSEKKSEELKVADKL